MKFQLFTFIAIASFALATAQWGMGYFGGQQGQQLGYYGSDLDTAFATNFGNGFGGGFEGLGGDQEQPQNNIYDNEFVQPPQEEFYRIEGFEQQMQAENFNGW